MSPPWPGRSQEWHEVERTCNVLPLQDPGHQPLPGSTKKHTCFWRVYWKFGWRAGDPQLSLLETEFPDSLAQQFCCSWAGEPVWCVQPPLWISPCESSSQTGLVTWAWKLIAPLYTRIFHTDLKRDDGGRQTNLGNLIKLTLLFLHSFGKLGRASSVENNAVSPPRDLSVTFQLHTSSSWRLTSGSGGICRLWGKS